MITKELVCAYCAETIAQSKIGNGASGGYGRDKDGNKVCFACCADLDRAAMRRDGKIVLYLSGVSPKIRKGFCVNAAWSISNWPGSLKFQPFGQSVKVSQTNWRLDRYDVWFVFEGYIWHGVSVGNDSELLHCKRTKEQYPRPPKDHWIGMAGLHGYMPSYYTVGATRGQCADDLGSLHELSGRKIKQMRRDNYLELDLYEHGNEYCEIVMCDCGKDISAHDDDPM